MAYLWRVDRASERLRSLPAGRASETKHPGPQVLLLLVFGAVGLIGSGCRFVSQGANTIPKDAVVVTVRVTPVGCDPEPPTVGAGAVDFAVRNVDAPDVSEVEVRSENLNHVLGEQENLVQGLSGHFVATISPGRYVVDCPGAGQSQWPFVVTSRSQ